MNLVKEVLEAIKNECVANDGHCDSCPFNISGAWFDHCFFQGNSLHEGITPEEWNLNKIKWDEGGVHGQ